jgi:predicted metal-dependent hydrolase
MRLGDLPVEVVRKEIKHLHLSVLPPTGRVRISAPARLSLESIRAFAVSKLPWIQRQRRRLREQERETRRDYVDRESHYLWGVRYLLHVEETDAAPTVSLEPRRLKLTIRPESTREQREAVVARWYRDQLRAEAAVLVARWEAVLGVSVAHLFVQHMRTRWGSCNPQGRTIRLNTELAKKPLECLEYIVVHEMVHLLEPSHNERFQSLMSRFLPRWRSARDRLNRFPVRHEDWAY